MTSPVSTVDTRDAAGPTSVESGSATAAVRLEGVVKQFGNDAAGRRVAEATGAPAGEAIVAVAGIDLEIRDGEFFSMLGPSGSGKTTTLRMIAGFETPTKGRIFLHGDDVSNRPPFERDVNTVFQDYALFPHMTVGQNVGYGLEVRKVARPEREIRVADALRMVRLEGYDARKPGQLSGGQRQRVALARALVNRPRVLLLDEPLGALDLKLREEMQIELKAIQQEVGITFIYVTHDQEEALTMSDRLAVFNRGRIEQVGTPADLYERPATAFVAGFVGTSNLIRGAAAEALLGSEGLFTVRPGEDPSRRAGRTSWGRRDRRRRHDPDGRLPRARYALHRGTRRRARPRRDPAEPVHVIHGGPCREGPAGPAGLEAAARSPRQRVTRSHRRRRSMLNRRSGGPCGHRGDRRHGMWFGRHRGPEQSGHDRAIDGGQRATGFAGPDDHRRDRPGRG